MPKKHASTPPTAVGLRWALASAAEECGATGAVCPPQEKVGLRGLAKNQRCE